MAAMLARLGRFTFIHRRVVVTIWLVIIGAATVAGLTAPAGPTDDFAMPGTESQRAFELMGERFPGLSADGGGGTVVFTAPEGQKITTPQFETAIKDSAATLSRGEQVAMVSEPLEAGSVSPDGTTAYLTMQFDVPAGAVTTQSKDEVTAVLDAARTTGLRADAGGDALESGGPTGVAEIIAISLAAVILFITLGSIVAAGLPLLTALVGVAVSMLSILAVASVFGLSTTSTTLALMLGLAVGIDYALFVLARYREERAAGRTAVEAIRVAVGTAGTSVTFAGMTVVIALAGLTVVGMPMLTKMGLAAAAAVVVAVLVALTLVPAVIGFVPDRVLSKSVRRQLAGTGGAAKIHTGVTSTVGDGELAADGVQAPAGSSKSGRWSGQRWIGAVMRRPVAVVLLGIAVLGALAIPVADLRLGMPGDESKSTATSQRRAYDALAEGFGPGFNGPLMIVVDAADAADPQAAVATVAQRIAATPGVVSVSPPHFNDAGDTAMLDAIPTTAPTDAATTDLVTALRTERSTVVAGTGANYQVTGTTAINIDMSAKIQGALVPYLATVVGLAVLLLLIVFRSILVPITAALGFLLSVLAALGLVVMVFQWGWLAGVVGVQVAGPIMSAVPIFVIGIVFGLAMDYEVFLVSRMREAYVHGAGPREAVRLGMMRSSRIIIAAALIMMAVFAGFIIEQDAFIKMLGFGLAVAVLFDAFVVRLMIIPAVLVLGGRWSWWLPAWLDRIVPHVDVEGTAVQGPVAVVAASRADASVGTDTKIGTDTGDDQPVDRPSGDSPARTT